MATVKTVTLGCKVNQYETEFVREGLLGIGYADAPADEPADLCIVNTCTVTNEGDSKSRQVIRRMHRDNPDARLVVMGCYATRAPDEVRQLPGVAEVVTDKRELPDLLGRFGVIDIPTGISGLNHRSRAYVKVQDGCLLRCSYCIIPKVRPEMYSRPPGPILDEIRRMIDNGYREIVLTGVHLGHYGVDFNKNKPKDQWMRLSHLVRQIVALDPDFRVRLSSIEATEVTRELVDVLGEFGDQVCPHLHVCLQSGSDSVLRRMKRRWGSQRFVDRCHFVTEHLDRPALTTDVIVGFPGETDEEFEETLNVCQQVGFSKIHMFPFSPRRDTPAASLDGQIPKSVKAERGKILAALETRTKTQYFDSLIGMQLRVLKENVIDDGNGERFLSGTSCRYAPVRIPVSGDIDAGPQRPGKIVNALIQSHDGTFLRAEADPDQHTA
ncbi:MAG: tRNA (N(6)-L-threonylcarbamoyladenosine(37)-C(2))-methylthiotransferase MtaB [Pirellulaceae bacterium]|nr:tRNA (N(6)-L-threonylcarbamoyladenosine(37)-C(2))-methylthiotransferase MtaB [Pirellulaceae bacterium]